MIDNTIPMEMYGVRLRIPRKDSDFETVLEGINNPTVRQFVTDIFPVYEDEEAEWFTTRSKRKSTDLVWAVDFNEGGTCRYVGNIGLHKINSVDRTANTGTILLNDSDRGKRIGSKAKMLLLNYAFNGLNLRKICSQVVEYNERSIRYSLRCGYHEEARIKQQVYRNGQYWDLVHLAIFRENFDPLWKKFLSGEDGL